MLADQQKLTFISFVRTLAATLRTNQVIGTEGERKSQELALLTCLDVEDDDAFLQCVSGFNSFHVFFFLSTY